MFTTVKNILFIVSLLISLNSFASELTKESVIKFLSEIDSAVNRLDADGVAEESTIEVINGNFLVTKVVAHITM
jgi:hypothetical protein